MIRLLHLSDVHLGAPFPAFGLLSDLRRQEVLEAFRGLPEIAETEQAHAVVIAGDLFDGPRPSEYTLAVTRQTLRKLVDSGCPVFVVPGHHDALPCNPGLFSEPLGGAFVFRAPAFGEPVTVETAGGLLNIYGFAYDPVREPDPLPGYRRHHLPGLHVVVAHGAVPGAPHGTASPDALVIPTEWLASTQADYLALGDWHDFRAPDQFDTKLPSRACYPGSYAAVDLTETGPRGYVIAELEEGEPPRVLHRSTRVLPVHDVGQFNATDFDDEPAVAAAIAARIEGPAIPIVTLVGEPRFPLQGGRVAAALEDRYVRARVEDQTWFAASPRPDEIEAQDTIAGHVVRVGRRRIDEEETDMGRVAAERALRLAILALGID